MKNSSFLLLSILFVSLILLAPELVSAQDEGIVWQEPINLSRSLESSGHPAIVSDAFGNVHIFWSEDVGGGQLPQEDTAVEGNTIMYTRWNGRSWTPPLDILFFPGDLAENISVVIDNNNQLHVVWTGQTKFYYSNAPAWDAANAYSWSKPVAVGTNSARSRQEADIAIDSANTIQILYATRGENNGIYFIESSDGGLTWSQASNLSGKLDSMEASFSNVQLVVDSNDNVHALWQTNEENGYGQAVYYTRSIDSGINWDLPTQLRYRRDDEVFVSWPYLVARDDGTLYLIYTDGTNKGRAQQISLDNGATWNKASKILDKLEGINGYVFPLIDSQGEMHLIANMRTLANQKNGIYYAKEQLKGWSPSVPIATEGPYAPSAHYTSGAVNLGNELHIVWEQLKGGEIWYMRGNVTSASAIPVSATPQFEKDVVLELAPISQPTPVVETSSIGLDVTPPEPDGVSIPPLVVGLGGAGLLILLVMALVHLR